MVFDGTYRELNTISRVTEGIGIALGVVESMISGLIHIIPSIFETYLVNQHTKFTHTGSRVTGIGDPADCRASSISFRLDSQRLIAVLCSSMLSRVDRGFRVITRRTC